MRMAVCAALGLATIMAASGPSAAQSPPAVSDTVNAMAGSWEVSNAARDITCIIAFKTDATAGGYRIEFDKAKCLGGFPTLKDAVAWALPNGDDNIVRLIDGKGKIVYEVETGMYESLKAGEPLTFLQNAAVAAAANANRSADQMTGEWNIVRGGGPPICKLILSNTPAGGALALKVNPGCDATVTAFGPTTWQMERNELVLKSARGQTWRFEESDGTWQRVPEGTDPLSMVRQ